MPESEDAAREGALGVEQGSSSDNAEEILKQRRAGRDREAYAATHRPRRRVAITSATLAAVGASLWFAAYFGEPDEEIALKIVVAASQLWPFLIGAAAIGWIIHQALPDD